MASGMDSGCVRPTTTTLHNMAALLGLIPGLAVSVYSVYIFDVGHPCYGQLTPVKTRYPLTSNTWPSRGLRFRAHWALAFFLSWPLTKCWFSIGLQAQVCLICGDLGRVVHKPVNANPGLKVDINFSSIQKFFTAFESWAPGLVQHNWKSKQKATLYTQKTWLTAKSQNSIQILAYYGAA